MSGFSWTAALTTTMLCLGMDFGAFFTDRWGSTCIDRPRLMMLGFFGESRNGYKCCTLKKYGVYYGQLIAPPIGRLTVYDMYGKSTSLHTLWPGDVFALAALLCWPSWEFLGQELSGTDLPLLSFWFFAPESLLLDCELCSEPIVERERTSCRQPRPVDDRRTIYYNG